LILRAGAEKVAINSAITRNPDLINKAALKFGSQCIVASIEAKKNESSWEVMIENGREKTGLDAIEWAKKVNSLGAGEILVTSIDKEGTKQGFDYELLEKISNSVDIPVIASGGMGTISDGVKVVQESNVDAVAIASILHYEKESISEIRKEFKNSGINVRDYNVKS
jgi:cyclase